MAPRRHHYLTAAYLAGFTETGDEDGFLVVSDLTESRQWKSRPRETAHIRDFYRIEGPPGEDPNSIEKQFGEIEGNGVAQIREIARTRAYPTRQKLGALINFTALTWCRTPRARAVKQKEFKEFLRAQALASLNEPGGFERMVAAAKARGEDIGPDVTRESMAKWAIEGDFEVSTHQNSQLNDMLFQGSIYFEEMIKMKWSLVRVDPSLGSLLTSDHPVALTPFSGDKVSGRIGLADPRCELSFPLTPNLALLGHWNTIYPKVIEANEQTLYKLNFQTVWKSDRFVFSKNEDFIWAKDEQGTVYKFRDLIEATKDGARQDYHPGPGYIEIPANFQNDPATYFRLLRDGKRPDQAS